MKQSSSVRVDLLLETGGGGSGRHVLDLYAGLRERGWDARLLLSPMRMDGIFSLEVAKLPREHVTFLKLRRSPHITDLAAIARLKHNMRNCNGRYLLHAHSTKAGMLGWALRGSPGNRILTPHAYRGMDPSLSGYRSTVIRQAEGLFSRAFHAVIAVSEDERAYTASLGIRPGSIYHVPNGVKACRILASRKNGVSNRSSCGPVLGFVGRLVYQKHPVLFLEVLSLLVARGLDITGHVVGDGPLLPHLKETAAQLKIADRIHWCGAVPAIAELGYMDVLVHTSIYESSPYSLLEAIAAQIPVVAVPNAGSRSIFGDLLPEVLQPDHSVEMLANAVESVLRNEDVQQRYQSQYPKIEARFSADRMVEETISVYKSVLENRERVRSRAAPLQQVQHALASATNSVNAV